MENTQLDNKATVSRSVSSEMLDRRLQLATAALKEISKTIPHGGGWIVPYGFEASELAEKTLEEMEAV